MILMFFIWMCLLTFCINKLTLIASVDENRVETGKAVPQHANGGAEGTGGIAPTHSRPWHWTG
jgi:hypothetical protein